MWDDLSYETLKNYLANSGNAAAKKVSEKSSATRDELVQAAQSAYASASSAGGSSYASATSYLAQATQTAKDNVFDTWSESDLKAYLDSYGVVSCPLPEVDRLILTPLLASSPGFHPQRSQGRGSEADNLLQVWYHQSRGHCLRQNW
jgi:hypothetical protein